MLNMLARSKNTSETVKLTVKLVKVLNSVEYIFKNSFFFLLSFVLNRRRRSITEIFRRFHVGKEPTYGLKLSKNNSCRLAAKWSWRRRWDRDETEMRRRQLSLLVAPPWVHLHLHHHPPALVITLPPCVWTCHGINVCVSDRHSVPIVSTVAVTTL